MSNSQEFVLPTVLSSNYMGMDIPTGFVLVNSFEVRGRTSSTEKNLSRDSSMSLTQSSIIYHEKMANNSMDIDQDPTVESPALSYEIEQEKALHLSKATETSGNMRLQNKNNKATPINLECTGNVNQGKWQQYVTASNDDDDNVINIQLPYDPNSPTEPELWSSNFHPISLHRSIEQIALDTKSIKNLLNFMAKYISNKKVNSHNANDLLDFDGIGDSIWNFISSVYQANWDTFYTNKNTMTLRAKIASKFSPRIALTTSKNNKEIPKSVLATIDKVSPPPPLPVKLKREVNVISKYFQSKKPPVKTKILIGNNNPARSYTQATKLFANTLEVLKIKEAFPALNAKKIDQISNIIEGNPKPKPQIQIMTKSPSRKQVIVLMSKENNSNFMKNLALHVVNINRQLWNAKSEVLVNYIWSNSLDITVITSKVSQQSDLLIID